MSHNFGHYYYSRCSIIIVDIILVHFEQVNTSWESIKYSCDITSQISFAFINPGYLLNRVKEDLLMVIILAGNKIQTYFNKLQQKA